MEVGLNREVDSGCYLGGAHLFGRDAVRIHSKVEKFG